jgi:hypothetical protein
MCDGAERDTVAKTKKPKPKKRKNEMMPNLSGVNFNDALKALLKTKKPK